MNFMTLHRWLGLSCLIMIGMNCYVEYPLSKTIAIWGALICLSIVYGTQLYKLIDRWLPK